MLTACIIALVLHELGHILTALSFSLKIRRVGIDWRGPYTVIQTGTRIQEAVTALAGPFVNLLTAILFWNQFPQLRYISLILGLTNLIPLWKTDGARAFQALVHKSVA